MVWKHQHHGFSTTIEPNRYCNISRYQNSTDSRQRRVFCPILTKALVLSSSDHSPALVGLALLGWPVVGSPQVPSLPRRPWEHLSWGCSTRRARTKGYSFSFSPSLWSGKPPSSQTWSWTKTHLQRKYDIVFFRETNTPYEQHDKIQPIPS